MNMGGMNGMMNPNMYMGNGGGGDYNKGRGKYNKERKGSYHDKNKSHHKNKPRSGSKDFNNHDGGKPAPPSNDNK